jgi:hypothetical protein
MRLHEDTSLRPLLAVQSDCHLPTDGPSSEEMLLSPRGLTGAFDGVE